MNSLASKKCTACSGDTSKLSPGEINKSLLELNNWILNEEGKMISKRFIF